MCVCMCKIKKLRLGSLPCLKTSFVSFLIVPVLEVVVVVVLVVVVVVDYRLHISIM
jgi:hypothetical protein